jgi:hypothetical protein
MDEPKQDEPTSQPEGAPVNAPAEPPRLTPEQRAQRLAEILARDKLRHSAGDLREDELRAAAFLEKRDTTPANESHDDAREPASSESSRGYGEESYRRAVEALRAASPTRGFDLEFWSDQVPKLEKIIATHEKTLATHERTIAAYEKIVASFKQALAERDDHLKSLKAIIEGYKANFVIVEDVVKEWKQGASA